MAHLEQSTVGDVPGRSDGNDACVRRVRIQPCTWCNSCTRGQLAKSEPAVWKQLETRQYRTVHGERSER
eukprot:539736-Rhodomonas_salina.5